MKAIANTDRVSYGLFRYIETGGESATVRPWVWISGLFIGPVVGTMAIQWYIFINVGLIK